MAGLKIVAVLALASFPLAHAGCVAQTKDEAMRDLRKSAGCSNPGRKPTIGLCNCKIQMPQVVCNAANRALWDGTGTPLKTWPGQVMASAPGGAATRCVKVTPDQTAAGKKHDFHYPNTYASECNQSGHEPGSYGCTFVKLASGELKSHVFAHTSGYNQGWNSSSWCTSKFCWVDPCLCDKLDIAKSTWLNGHYSYSKCGNKDVFTKGDCKGGTDNATCSAIPKCKWSTSALVASASSVNIGIVSVLLLLSFAN